MIEIYGMPISVKAIEKIAFDQIKQISVKRRGII